MIHYRDSSNPEGTQCGKPERRSARISTVKGEVSCPKCIRSILVEENQLPKDKLGSDALLPAWIKKEDIPDVSRKA
jgi:hypothetical protein